MSSKYPIDLKPCPFCGEAPALLRGGFSSFTVACMNPKCPVKPETDWEIGDSQAAQSWNTRKESKP